VCRAQTKLGSYLVRFSRFSEAAPVVDSALALSQSASLRLCLCFVSESRPFSAASEDYVSLFYVCCVLFLSFLVKRGVVYPILVEYHSHISLSLYLFVLLFTCNRTAATSAGGEEPAQAGRYQAPVQ
jgi:hypothetical protein